MIFPKLTGGWESSYKNMVIKFWKVKCGVSWNRRRWELGEEICGRGDFGHDADGSIKGLFEMDGVLWARFCRVRGR